MKTVTRLALALLLVASLAAPSAVLAADADPPVMTAAPTASLIVGSKLGTWLVPARISWAAYDALDTTPTYHVQRSTDGGGWVNVATTTAKTYTQQLDRGHKYRFRAYAVDDANNWTGWSYGPVFVAGGYAENSGSVSYTSGWTRRSMAYAYGGSVKTAKTAGATASFTFYGRAVAWIAPKYWSGWMADVYVDGTYVGKVDLYSGSAAYRVVVFSKMWTTNGTHTIKVKVSASVNPYHPNVDIDAFIVLRNY
jgi:hypothetical protein